VPEAEAAAEREWRAREEAGLLESTALEAALREAEFPEGDRLEKEALLAEGFPSWGKVNLRVYISACEKHGRANVDAVVAEVADNADKAPEEVRRYHAVFWERYGEVSDGLKMLERVEKGEQRLKKNKATEAVIAEKVARSPDPFRTLHVPYGSDKRATQRGYSEEEDRFLICMLNVLGYGAWDALKAEIRRAEAFRFDFFIKSRSAGDLTRRADTLIRLLEKEAVDAGTAAGREIMAAGGPKLGRGRGAAAGKAEAAGGEAAGDAAKKKRKRGGADAAGKGSGKKAAKAAAEGGGGGGGEAAAEGAEEGAEGLPEGRAEGEEGE
jgi:SWI/SNF-related matrix-associated actin-dependent regulator of chromatin subfamily A member 5